MENFILECCVDSVESAINAEKGGASRLELCSNLIIGGTSPDVALFHQVRKATNVRVHALIRPRFGDFCYSAYEIEIMKEQICSLKEAGVEGFVIGVLDEEGYYNPEINTDEVHVYIHYGHASLSKWNTPDCTVPYYEIYFGLKEPVAGCSLSSKISVTAVDKIQRPPTLIAARNV